MTDRTVLFVSDFGTVKGGAEQVAITGAVALANAGQTVRFLAGSNVLDPRLAAAGVETFHSDRTGDERPLIWDEGGASHMRRALAGLDPKRTVVHFHSYLNNLSPAAMKAAMDGGYPIVMTLHDYGVACPNMGFYIFPEARKCPLRPLSFACVTTQCSKSGWVSKLGLTARTTLLARRVGPLKNVRAFVALGPRNASVVQRFADPKIPFVTVDNIYPETQSPPLDVAGNTVLVSVGRLVREKDPVAMARAARRANVPLVFVGDGPERAAVAEANPDAEITGWVERATVMERMKAARGHVMASRWWEGSPLVVTDALALGLPNLLPDEMSGAERIVPGETGLHFRLDDEASLIAGMTSLQDPATAARLGRAGYDRFWANPPTAVRHARELIALYDSLLGGG